MIKYILFIIIIISKEKIINNTFNFILKLIYLRLNINQFGLGILKTER